MRRVFLSFVILLIATVQAEAQSEPILRLKLEKDSAIPGQPIELTVTLLVPTWLLKPPRFPNFDTPNAMVRLPPRASSPVSERVGDETWSGVIRSYLLYPMGVGQFRVPPQTMAVTYAHPKTLKPTTVHVNSKEFVFKGEAPQGAEKLSPFIAAHSLKLEQIIEGDANKLKPGKAFTRTVKAEITGMSPIYLPPLIVPFEHPGLRAYPKEPIVTEKTERGIVSGERLESVTYVAEAGGRFAAPPVRLEWYNLESMEIETVEADGFGILAEGPALSTSTFEWRSTAPWVVAGMVLLALAIWWGGTRLWPRFRAWRTRRREAWVASEAYAFALATKSLRARNFGDALRAVELWSSRSLANSEVEQARLSKALAGLGALLHGRDPQTASGDRQWSEALSALRAARHTRLASLAVTRVGDTLPPLNPQGIA